MAQERALRLIIRLVAVSLATVPLSGCLHHPLKSSHRAAQPLPATFKDDLASASPVPVVVENREIKATSRYSVQRMALGIGDGNSGRKIEITYFAPKACGPRAPAIVVLPIMGGDSYALEKHFAAGFAGQGYFAAIVHRPNLKDEIQSLDDIDGLLRESIRDARRVVDWLEKEPNIDPQRLGLFGISLGAIRGALMMAVEDRFRAGVLGLGGGDLPKILTSSEDKNLVRHRKRLLERHSLSVSEAEEKLREAITCEPLTLAAAVDPSKVLLVIAAFDRVVPARNGWQLRRKMGDPETIELCGGHYSSVVHIPYLRGASCRFFERKFADKPTEKLARWAGPHP